MHPTIFKRLLAGFASCAALLLHCPAQADEAPYPSRPVRMVVPFPPGSTSDLAARAIAQHIQVPLQQPVIVENRPGANGALGMNHVAKSRPDGYTIVVGSISSTAVPAVMLRKPSFDLARDFSPVGVIAGTPLLLVVSQDSPYKNLQELIQAAKSQPAALTYANSAGLFQLAMESLKMQAGINLSEIAYKGPAEATTDLLAGRITVQPDSLGSASKLIDGQRTRALAVLSSGQIPSLPGMPTMQELGYKDFDFNGWIGVLAPAGTPQPIIDRLYQSMAQAIQSPEIRKIYASTGMDPVSRPPGEYRELLEREMRKYEKIRQAAGIEQK